MCKIALTLLITCTSLVMASKDFVKKDSQSFGGESLRGVDDFLSNNLGGYKSGQEPGIYGKYVEPIAHAATHIVRGIEGTGNWDAPLRMNQAEWARAKEELKTVGSTLNSNNHKYQYEVIEEEKSDK